MKTEYKCPDACNLAVETMQLLAQSSASGTGIDYGDPIIIPGSDIF